ncbi:MAG: oxidoreductase [Thermoplasmatota archaeon]
MEVPKVAVFKFTGCAGCQMELLRVFDEAEGLMDKMEVRYFKMAAEECLPGHYDIALVEGSVSTPRELREIKKLRQRSRTVVALGDCAISGCVPSIRSWMPQRVVERMVYGDVLPIDSIPVRGISEYILVEHQIPGCPPDKSLISGSLVNLLQNIRPYIRPHAVCIECKMDENTCLLTSFKQPCMGPVTRAGCHALCPSGGRVCEGCYGPMNDPNPRKLAETFRECGLDDGLTVRKFRKYAGLTREFSREADGN